MPVRIIKRYKNRRLYDTSRKATIKFEDIAKLIKDDIEFKIVDNATGRDVTLSVLSQLFSKETKDWKDLSKSSKTIKRIFKLGGEEVMDFFEKMALVGLGLFDVTKEKVEEVVDDLVKRGEISKGDKAKVMKSVIDGHKKRTEKIKSKIEEGIKKAIDKVKNTEKNEMKELHSKIEKLAQAVEKLEKKLNK